MDPRLGREIEAAILAATGSAARIASEEVVSGGSIHAARRLLLTDGRRFFCKSGEGHAALPGIFEAEATGLDALRRAGVFRVPELVVASPDFLLLEAIVLRGPGAGFFVDFGQKLARLHREARAERFGFAQDNFLGASPQSNGWRATWSEFWRDARLGPQLAMLRHQGIRDKELESLGDRLMDRLPEWLSEVNEAPSLLHGDLWAGNFLSDEKGQPVLVDPAVYYGHREAELAMTRLFGGFSADFHQAYEEAWPLAPGAEERGKIYELYHLLNHYNLFGASYRGACLAILRRLA